MTLEHQHLAERYVIRGVESGGAIPETGRYVTFSGESGEQLAYLQPIDGLGVNGLHAVVVALVLVRIDLFRAGRTCQLLIAKHPAFAYGRNILTSYAVSQAKLFTSEDT